MPTSEDLTSRYACIEVSRARNFSEAREGMARPALLPPGDFVSALALNDTVRSRYGVIRTFLSFDTSEIRTAVFDATLTITAKQAGSTRILAFLEDPRRGAGAYRDRDFLSITDYRSGSAIPLSSLVANDFVDTSTISGTLVPIDMKLNHRTRQLIRTQDHIGIVICAFDDATFAGTPPASGMYRFNFVSPDSTNYVSGRPTLRVIRDNVRAHEMRSGGRNMRNTGRLIQGRSLMGLEEDDI